MPITIFRQNLRYHRTRDKTLRGGKHLRVDRDAKTQASQLVKDERVLKTSEDEDHSVLEWFQSWIPTRKPTS